MANPENPQLVPPSAEHRKVAAGQFERANQVIATGNYDYGIRLLLSCCKLEPANLIFRQALRRTEKAKFHNNLRGSWHAALTTWPTRAKIKTALRSSDYLKVLELGEVILVRNPWDTSAQKDMAQAADGLGLLDLAIWTLEQARQKNPRDPTVNRALAKLFEKRGHFTQAIGLWELVRQALPRDLEAQHKVKDLAVSETIARGHYEQAVVQATAPPGSGEHANAQDKPVLSPRLKTSGSSGNLPAVGTSAAVNTPIAQMQARIEADPANVNTYLQLAGYFRKLSQLDQARGVLQKGLEPTGQAFELVLELAELDIEPFRGHLASTEEKLRAAPANEQLRQTRARLSKEINSRELELFRKKADRYPTEMVHRFELGVRLLRSGQVDDAIRELQAVRSDPRHHWRALLYLAHCFKARNNWRLAKRNFEECLQNLPPGETEVRKEVLFQLAQGSAEAGDLSSAVDLAHELANLDFGYRDIGRLLDEWQNRLEQADV
jgi:tetratricopeptide (TPR) repeat protein